MHRSHDRFVHSVVMIARSPSMTSLGYAEPAKGRIHVASAERPSERVNDCGCRGLSGPMVVPFSKTVRFPKSAGESTATSSSSLSSQTYRIRPPVAEP
ncbi:MAG: hypothetical protein DRJ42_02875 [Deltaproteobacteria bacterium]|nr:MAG: hypothetical protein DRJ42_02875 [Deltaproteobacteria bacterium]